jgi:hypothetical protein
MSNITLHIPLQYIEQVAKEFDLPVSVVERMYRHQYKMVMIYMAEGEKPIRLRNFGVFFPKVLAHEKNKAQLKRPRTSPDSNTGEYGNQNEPEN